MSFQGTAIEIWIAIFSALVCEKYEQKAINEQFKIDKKGIVK